MPTPLKIRGGEHEQHEVAHTQYGVVKLVCLCGLNNGERRNVVFECGCVFASDMSLEEVYCPTHGMPMRIEFLDYRDLEWLHHELSVHGMFSVDDLDNEG